MGDVSAANAANVALYDESGNRVGTTTNPISVNTPEGVTVNLSEFARIESKRFAITEEVRFDIPSNLAGNSVYVGVAADGASTAAASWTVIRTYFGATGNPERKRIRFGVVWDNRTAGWT